MQNILQWRECYNISGACESCLLIVCISYFCIVIHNSLLILFHNMTHDSFQTVCESCLLLILNSKAYMTIMYEQNIDSSNK